MVALLVASNKVSSHEIFKPPPLPLYWKDPGFGTEYVITYETYH